MTNGLRNHPGPGPRIKSWADKQRSALMHRKFWFYYAVAWIFLVWVLAAGHQ